MTSLHILLLLFFFNDTATTEIYTLSLHDALPISHRAARAHTTRRDLGGVHAIHGFTRRTGDVHAPLRYRSPASSSSRSEEHTSELQSRLHLVCRLLLEKKKKNH